jgi:hypothetical protein
MRLLFLVICLVTGLAGEASAQCLPSLREVKYADGSARLKDYVCKLADSAGPQLRIEFDRLSEAAAGSLVEQSPYPDMQSSFQSVRLFDNAVDAEAKALFDKFGTKEARDGCFDFSVKVAAGGKNYAVKDPYKNCGQRTLWYFRSPEKEAEASDIVLPEPEDNKYIKRHLDWPSGYQYFYRQCDPGQAIECTVLWRNAKPADIADYAARRRAYEKSLGIEDQPADPADSQGPAKYLSLVAYVLRNGWRDDFQIVSAEGSVDAIDDMCSGFSFTLHTRQLVLDIAMIENLSRDAISIDGLSGTQNSVMEARPETAGKSAPASPIPIPPIKLGPGQKLVIPLRIGFVMSDSLADLFRDRATAQKSYKQIRSASSGTVFATAGSTDPNGAKVPPVRKTRDSFGPPTVAMPPLYVYGPEIELRGVVLDGERLDFENASRNFMHLIVAGEYGSCPFLYAYDDRLKAWVDHGKIIDAARSKDKETTQTKTIAGFASKFKISEQELEVSFIDRARLTLSLVDGRNVELAPDKTELVEADGRYAVIKSGQTMEFSFALPDGLKPEDVRQSTLAITGYYQQYSRMQVVEQ